MILALCSAVAIIHAAQPPVITLTADNTRIDTSCIIRIPPGLVIADTDGDGVLHIVADDITVAFEPGSALRGAPPSADPDTYAGVGIRIDGRSGVTISSARVSGFKVGLNATSTPRLTIDAGDYSDNFRQRLLSTPRAENAADWLWPHKNDDNQWLARYGAAIAIADADNLTVRRVRIRHGQNGIILSRVNNSRVYDNDASFLSGWGLALWRSSNNTITRNAFDFCVRGYSHGVYNRGQDSAGILMFEQCSDNLIAENSATHGGDGLFGFAGHEAIGESPAPAPDFDYTRRGCNDNRIIANDFSYAPAHGLEMTFSAGNIIANNRFVENAITGIWAGYSNDTQIIANTFERNGDAGYGLERGAINIEHGSGNRILGNTFSRNAVGVHLWWDNDAALLAKPGVARNHRGVTDNHIIDNRFDADAIGLRLRDASADKNQVRGTIFAHNQLANVPTPLELQDRISVEHFIEMPLYGVPAYTPMGSTSPVGARAHLRGRHNIIMTAWGPWDHESPLVRQIELAGPRAVYELRRIPTSPTADTAPLGPVIINAADPRLNVRFHRPDPDSTDATLTITAPGPGVWPFAATVAAGDFSHRISATLVAAEWDVRFFTWDRPAQPGPPAPPTDLDAWRARAESPAARVTLPELRLQLGSGGPSRLRDLPEPAASTLAAARLPGEYYGLIATTSIPIPAGRWTLSTLSDDGVRVLVDGKTILENWTHHGPTLDTAQLTLDQARDIAITVEYVQISGHAVLEFAIAPSDAPPQRP